MVMAAVLMAAGSASALMVVEDFDTYEQGSLIYGSGGSGFLDHWSSGNMNVSTNANLSYIATGYAVSSLGTGMCVGTNETFAKLSFRNLAAPITGTPEGCEVWFSTLVRPKLNGRIGWNFNPADQSRESADAGFIVVDTEFRWVTNGVMVASSESLAYNTTHLVMGRVVLKETGLSTFSLWLDPTDVTSSNTLGAADFNVTADFGGSITRIGMEGYRSETTAMDALRISDGTGDANQAFLDVTRATSSVLFGPVEFASLHELTNNFAMLDATSSDWTPDGDDNYGQGGYLKPVSVIAHHTFVIDCDGAPGGGDDVFGECTIDFDCRQDSHCGVVFYGVTDPALRTKKHWVLVSSASSAAQSMVRLFYNRNINNGTGHLEEDRDVSYSLDGSTWRHVRVDVRRVNNFSQVEARTRVWDNADDFRETPSFDKTVTYAVGHSHPYAGEIGFTGYSTSGVSGELDNVAVYRYGTAPDWFKPKGMLILLK